VTSWGWIFLTDFGPQKPCTMPSKGAWSFYFYFAVGGKQRCYVAPERFHDSNISEKRLVKLDPKNDIFSVGCCIYEIFTDGEVLFQYSDLLQFKSGNLNPTEKFLVQKEFQKKLQI